MDLIKPKNKKTKKKAKKSKKKNALVKAAPLPSLRLNENADAFYDIIERIYKDADDSALAAAKFEADLISKHVDLSEEGQEVPDEFQREFFHSIHRKLLELRALKDFAEAFKLGSYLDEIMSTRIKYLFGDNVKTTLSRGSAAGKNFYGSDEEFLIQGLREKLRSSKSRR